MQFICSRHQRCLSHLALQVVQDFSRFLRQFCHDITRAAYIYDTYINECIYIYIYITKYLPSWDEEYPIRRVRAHINTKSLRPFYIIHIFTATNAKRRILFLNIKQNCIFPANMLLLHGNHNSEK